MSRLRSQPLPIALAISIGLGLSIALIAHATLPGWRWYHPLVHTAIEALGGLCAIVLALVLFKQDIAGHHIRFLPLAIGCLFMGILEEFHAVAEPGNGFILLRSLASLSGAVGFALAWKSNAPVRADESGLVPWVTAVCAVFLGTFIISFPDRLPVMAFDGAFTPDGDSSHRYSYGTFSHILCSLLVGLATNRIIRGRALRRPRAGIRPGGIDVYLFSPVGCTLVVLAFVTSHGLHAGAGSHGEGLSTDAHRSQGLAGTHT